MMRLTSFLALCAYISTSWAGDIGPGTGPGTIPEPGTYALLGIGAIALFIANRRKK